MYNEDGDFESDKFDECYMCINRFKERICDDCGSGEYFEEQAPDDLEDLFKER